MIRILLKALAALLMLGLAAVGGALWWLQQPLDTGAGAPTLDLSIEPGTTPRAVAEAVVDAGADTSASVLYLWFRMSGQDRLIRAGSYEIAPGTSPRRLLAMLVRGEESLRTVTLVEGWHWRQVRQALNPTLEIAHYLLTMSEASKKLSSEVEEELRSAFGSRVFKNVIPYNVKLAEAPSMEMSVLKHASSSRGAKAYRAVAKELSHGRTPKAG